MFCKEEENNLNEDFSWDRCTWTRLRDNATCKYRYHRNRNDKDGVVEIYDVCRNGLHGGLFFGSEHVFQGGENNVCGITIPTITERDHGYWMCSLDYYNLRTQNACTTNTEVYVKVHVVPLIILPIPIVHVSGSLEKVPIEQKNTMIKYIFVFLCLWFMYP